MAFVGTALAEEVVVVTTVDLRNVMLLQHARRT